MSYDWWARWDRVACRVAGHSWLEHQSEWRGAPVRVSTCVRCGTNGRSGFRGRPRPTSE